MRLVVRTLLLAMATALPAHAVVVRGRVTTAQGAPAPGARVQLVEGGRVVALSFAGRGGDFEIRTGDTGRFTLLTFLNGYFPAVGENFYGAATAVVLQNVVLSRNSLVEDASPVETGVFVPFALLPQPAYLITEDDLATRVGVAEEMRQQPGAFVVRAGQWGAETWLAVRGGPSDGNKVLIDGVAAVDIGGRFDFGAVSSTGIASLEVDRGANSALYGSDARAAVVSLRTTRGQSTRPRLDYSGDAGNLHTFRNEASIEGVRRKLDYLAAYSWFQTSNALPNDEFHDGTAAASLGYALASRTLFRATARQQISATGLPGAYDFYGLAQSGKRSDQDIYAQATLEHRSEGDWHNLLRYGLARKREQQAAFGAVGTPAPGGQYLGNLITIRGANGYALSGTLPLPAVPQGGSEVSNRNQLDYQTDTTITRHVTALAGFQYEDERGTVRPSGISRNAATQRTNLTYNALLQGDVKTRVFFSLGGAFEKNHLYGAKGTPRLGLTWVAVRQSERKFRGTVLHANVATGVQEPSLSFEFASLYSVLSAAGNTAAIAAYGVRPLTAGTSRTYDVRVDQNILGSRLAMKGGYFHSQFDHGVESISASALQQYFGIATAPALVSAAFLNSLAYRAQGGEFEVQYQPTHRFYMRGGYTFLAPLVERSFSSGGAAVNPLLPGVAIGATSPLVGGRPFRLASQTAFVAVQYTRVKYTIGMRGAFAGRSDDSTFLAPRLLLPNRDLDHGYARLDAHATAVVTTRATAFIQVENLVNDQHIGPIGYPGLPLTVRAGLKIRVGGD